MTVEGAADIAAAMIIDENGKGGFIKRAIQPGRKVVAAASYGDILNGGEPGRLPRQHTGDFLQLFAVFRKTFESHRGRRFSVQVAQQPRLSVQLLTVDHQRPEAI